ncbi:DoxX family protein [Flaviaesturariibacter amylovorans]|uniref:DoxX family protein n=1 Tax=Flaviaesturariibacter amylovorans TaxID=1084520 RepID=A0ABP8HTD7_9BACT
MKRINLLYWIFNGLFCLLMLGSAYPNIISDPLSVQGMHKELGFPLYFIPFIGWAKALGALTLLLPAPARLKEWAYAGLVFDLIGALFSIYMIGKPDWVFLFIPLALAACAYLTFRKRETLRRERKHNASVHLRMPSVA